MHLQPPTFTEKSCFLLFFSLPHPTAQVARFLWGEKKEEEEEESSDLNYK